ncbi:MAG: aminoglycoside phosphotransferase family protein [Candidatus Kapaibacterium sp.]
MSVPDALAKTITRAHGDPGRRWLAALPSLLDRCRCRWGLTLDAPFDDLSYNLVIPGTTAEGMRVVLKLGVPCVELENEARALVSFNGTACARLLDHDLAAGALLLERATPGMPLHTIADNSAATRAAATVMRKLWRTPPSGHQFPSLAGWFGAFQRLRNEDNGGTFPREVIANAERIVSELCDSAERTALLHGDLHHANILSSSEHGWMAIDPKGVCGDPGYEVGSFMINHLPSGISDSETIDIFNRRLAIFEGELNIDRKRLARWAFCHAVLSAVWSLEELSEWRGTIRLALLLHQLCE